MLNSSGLLSWRRNDAKLLQHAQLVNICPVLHQLATDYTGDVNLRPGCLLAGGGNPQKCTLLRPTRRQAVDDRIPFGDLVFNRILKVGEGSAKCGDKLFEPIEIARDTGSSDVLHIIGGHDLVRGGEVSLIEDLERGAPR